MADSQNSKWRTVRISFLFTMLCAFIFSLIAIWGANTLIISNAKNKTFASTKYIRHCRVGLLLGTSKHVKSGRINLYFQYRIEAATVLLKEHKIDYLIISGDNSTKEYDEPTDMKLALIQNGVDSTKIYLDYAGFRTFDSIVRAKEIFGQEEVLIISQKFHNERAIYIADQIGLKATAYNARDVGKYYGFKTAFREKLARVKVLLDCGWGVSPKFLGERITIK